MDPLPHFHLQLTHGFTLRQMHLSSSLLYVCTTLSFELHRRNHYVSLTLLCRPEPRKKMLSKIYKLRLF